MISNRASGPANGSRMPMASSGLMNSSGTICVMSPTGTGSLSSFPTPTGPVAGARSAGSTCATGPFCTNTRFSLSRIASSTLPSWPTGTGAGVVYVTRLSGMSSAMNTLMPSTVPMLRSTSRTSAFT